jgi:ABC-type nitrate/sulfonate/bicarbonate transport system substrate-binding protein
MVRLRITPTTDRDVCGGGRTRLLETEIVAVILTWPTYPLATSRDFIKARPDIVRGVVKASVEATHYIKTHRQGEIIDPGYSWTL